MTDVLATLLSGLLWSFLLSELTFGNFFIGALLGIGLLSLVRRGQAGSFPRRIWAAINFFLQFMWELFLANIIIAMLALKPRPRFYPHIISVPLTVTSDAAIALLSAPLLCYQAPLLWVSLKTAASYMPMPLPRAILLTPKIAFCALKS